MKQIITNFNNAPKKIAHILWGGVLAGTLTILAILLLLNLLGAGLGISAYGEINDPFVSVGTTIWLFLTNIIAVFTGGLLAARTAGLTFYMDGALQGFLAWALYIILSSAFYISIMGNDVSALLNIGFPDHSFLLFWVLLFGAMAGICGGIVGAILLLNRHKKEKLNESPDVDIK
ncbi:hypothetical protein [Aequorivita capsosiphonis]|uniref:hypothetical protein n=1 Tax=Aequorivita capsosiphonis TaxID=487317 RepID=UPI000419AFCF|nr:hypothetical protein [Aequorivita capsosiphonis]